MAKQSAAFDINSFDAVAETEKPFKLSVLNPDGVTESGIVLHVLGRFADPITKWASSVFNKYQREELLAKKTGKEPQRTVEELREQNFEAASIRVVGWDNVQQPFDRELLKNALRRNPHWVEQINQASEDLANFTTKPEAS